MSGFFRVSVACVNSPQCEVFLLIDLHFLAPSRYIDFWILQTNEPRLLGATCPYVTDASGVLSCIWQMKSKVLRVVTSEGSLSAARSQSLTTTRCVGVSQTSDYFLQLGTSPLLYGFSLNANCTLRFLLHNTVINTKCLWILLYLLSGFVESGKGGITNLLLLPSECRWWMEPYGLEGMLYHWYTV